MIHLEETDNPTEPYTVFCGPDVGKETHHATALNPADKKLHDRLLPNDEPALRQVFTQLTKAGRVPVIVDQPASIGALAIAGARQMGLDVAYLPGLAMRRLADLHPGESKTDARDAYVIADAARTLPHTLRRVGTDDETLAGLTVLVGYDSDLATEATRLTNRLRDALLHIHPAAERLLGRHIHRPGVLELLADAATPADWRQLGETGITETMRPRSPRLAKTLPAHLIRVLGEQTVVVPGTAAFGRIIAGVARKLLGVLDERADLAKDVEATLEAHPLSEVLISMPGVGISDRRQPADDHRGRVRVPDRSPSRRLRRPGPGHPPFRQLDPRRGPFPARQPRPEIDPVPVGVRQSRRPDQPGLLRPQTRRRQAAQRRPDLPRPPPRRHPLRHDPRPQALPAARYQPRTRTGPPLADLAKLAVRRSRVGSLLYTVSERLADQAANPG